MADQPTTEIGVRDRLRYRFDNLLSRGTGAVLLFLFAVTVGAIMLSALLLAVAGVTFAGSEGTSFFEDSWQSLLRVIDPGTMAADVGWGRRLLALLVTFFGILIAGTLIGLIATGFEQRIEDMQRGRSVVAESGHVLILGFSSRLPIIVNQLTLANRRRRGNAVVVLADCEPRELSEEVRSFVGHTRGSRLVFRSGDPARRADLAIVGVDRARAVIVLADEDAENDAAVVNATLAVGAALGSFGRVPIVAELRSTETAETLSVACGGKVHAVVPLQGIARITAFTLGEPGLHQVVEELIDFRGSDIYIRPPGDLVGSTFGQSIHRFADAHPIGRMGPGGDVELNPPPDTVLVSGDRLIVIAEDDTETLEPRVTPATRAIPTTTRPAFGADSREEHFLLIGWNGLGHQLLGQLSEMSAPGSSVEIIYDARLFDSDELDVTGSGDMTVTLTPTRLDVWKPPDETALDEVTSIVLLGYRRRTSVEKADSRTLLHVMLLRRLMEMRSDPPRIVAELVNADNVELARMTGADDFLVSDAISSRFIAQLAEQPERRDVIISLYSPEGPSVRLVEAGELGVVGTKGWDEVIDEVYAEGLLAIGWRRSSERGGQLALNPNAGEQVTLGADDQIVVVA